MSLNMLGLQILDPSWSFAATCDRVASFDTPGGLASVPVLPPMGRMFPHGLGGSSTTKLTLPEEVEGINSQALSSFMGDTGFHSQISHPKLG